MFWLKKFSSIKNYKQTNLSVFFEFWPKLNMENSAYTGSIWSSNATDLLYIFIKV